MPPYPRYSATMEILSFPFLFARKFSHAFQACALILPLCPLAQYIAAVGRPQKLERRKGRMAEWRKMTPNPKTRNGCQGMLHKFCTKTLKRLAHSSPR